MPGRALCSDSQRSCVIRGSQRAASVEMIVCIELTGYSIGSTAASPCLYLRHKIYQIKLESVKEL